MKNYQSPEAVEIGKADEVILGLKDGQYTDAVDNTIKQPLPGVVDMDE